METRGAGNSGGNAGNGDSPVVPPWQQQVILLMRVECLFGAAQKAIEGGDEATAARMTAEAIETIGEARRLAERARNV